MAGQGEQDEVILALDYREQEVVSAQRARLRHGSRLRIGLLFGLVAVGLIVFARFTNPAGAASRGGILIPVLLLLACFAGVLLFSWRFAPLIDFRSNLVWRQQHRLRLTSSALYLEPADGGAGTALPWQSLRRVLETRYSYVLVFRSEREFLIVPKRILGEHEAGFRERLHAGRTGA